jgi:hypothetical protein
MNTSESQASRPRQRIQGVEGGPDIYWLWLNLQFFKVSICHASLAVIFTLASLAESLARAPLANQVAAETKLSTFTPVAQLPISKPVLTFAGVSKETEWHADVHNLITNTPPWRSQTHFVIEDSDVFVRSTLD